MLSYETAAFWLDTIALIAAGGWFAGAVFVFRTARSFDAPSEGRLEIDLPPGELIAGMQRALGTGIANSPLSGVELLDAPGDALAWRGGGLSQTGSLRATSRGGGRSTVACQVEMRGGPLTAARWIVAGGALMIAVIYWVLSEFALPSEHPGARGQVFQMAQAIHVLWPPFLTAGLARVGRRKLIADLERTLRNLAFVSPA